jgi:predicted permease
MRRELRSRPRREVVLGIVWAALFSVLLALRVALQRTAAEPVHSLAWLRIGSVGLLGLLILSASLGTRAPVVGSVVLRVEQAAAFVAITRLLGLGSQPDPGRAEQVLIALLVVHGLGAIVVSDELSTGTPSWRAGLWALALSFGALTISVLAR